MKFAVKGYMVKEFTANGITYEFDRTIKPKRTRATFACSCGSEKLETVFEGGHVDYFDFEKLMQQLGSMEINVLKCLSCGQLYLETEVNDYDYFYYRGIKQK